MSTTMRNSYRRLAANIYGPKRLAKMLARIAHCYANGGRVQVKRWSDHRRRCLWACGWDCVGRFVGDRVNLMIRPAGPVYDGEAFGITL